MALSREIIVSTALTIMDSYGLADVSMRRIATALEVQPSALYWHVDSKQDLLSAMTETILADLPPLLSADPVRLRLWAARFHTLLLRHRGGAELVASALAIRSWDDTPAASVEARLLAESVPPATAHAAAHGLMSLILGHAFAEEQRAQAKILRVDLPERPWDQAESLDGAVALIVAGIFESQ